MHACCCRFCGALLRATMVALGLLPLAHAYLTAEQLYQMEPFYPLRVYVCALLAGTTGSLYGSRVDFLGLRLFLVVFRLVPATRHFVAHIQEEVRPQMAHIREWGGWFVTLIPDVAVST